MAANLALEEARLVFQRALDHNKHTEDVAVLLLGFTGVIFAAIYTYGIGSIGSKLTPFGSQVLDESLIALGISAGLSAFTLVTTYIEIPRFAFALRFPRAPLSLLQRLTAIEYQLEALYVAFDGRFDDFLFENSVFALGGGVTLAILTRLDPLTSLDIGVIALAIGATFVTYQTLTFRSKRISLLRIWEELILERVRTYAELSTPAEEEISDD